MPQAIPTGIRKRSSRHAAFTAVPFPAGQQARARGTFQYTAVCILVGFVGEDATARSEATKTRLASPAIAESWHDAYEHTPAAVFWVRSGVTHTWLPVALCSRTKVYDDPTGVPVCV
jgi:hypothetical protein